jgi:hypothetical protein
MLTHTQLCPEVSHKNHTSVFSQPLYSPDLSTAVFLFPELEVILKYVYLNE